MSICAQINDKASWFEMVLRETKLTKMCDKTRIKALTQKKHKNVVLLVTEIKWLFKEIQQLH